MIYKQMTIKVLKFWLLIVCLSLQTSCIEQTKVSSLDYKSQSDEQKLAGTAWDYVHLIRISQSQVCDGLQGGYATLVENSNQFRTVVVAVDSTKETDDNHFGVKIPPGRKSVMGCEKDYKGRPRLYRITSASYLEGGKSCGLTPHGNSICRVCQRDPVSGARYSRAICDNGVLIEDISCGFVNGQTDCSSDQVEK